MKNCYEVVLLDFFFFFSHENWLVLLQNKALKAENSELKTGHCAVRQTMQILSGQQSGGT